MSSIHPNIKTEENKYSLDNINIISNINPTNIQNNKKNSLYIRPLSVIEKNDERINKLIRSSFEDPSQFFDIDTKVQIGKRIRLQKMDLLNQKDKHRGSYSIRSPIKKVNLSTKISITDTSKSLQAIKEKPNPKSLMLNKEIIDNNNLKKIFENYKNKIYTNKNLRKNESSFSRSVKDINKSCSINNKSKLNTINLNEEFPFDLYNSLNYQNKRINDELNYFNRIKNTSKKLSKKSNKKEDDLLFNKVDLFKYKKEILSGFNKEKIPEKFVWNISLRRPINFKGKIEYPVNINSEKNPFWGLLVERYPNQKEFSVKPGYNLNQKEFMQFSRDINDSNKKTNSVNNIKNLDDLKVVGNNLLDIEYEREMKSKGRKILHKAFVENGKAILNQDINDIFGEKTLYKNYENDNKNKYNYIDYLKGNKPEKSIWINSFSEKNDNNNNSFVYNNFQTIPSKI